MLDKDGILWKTVSDTTFERSETAQSAVKAILADNITTDGHGCLSVVKVERKTVRTEPPLLYDLTTLQKETNRKYSFSVDTTLSFPYPHKWILLSRQVRYPILLKACL